MVSRDTLPRAVRRVDYRPPAYWIDAVDLTFELDPDSTRVAATLAFRRNVDTGMQQDRHEAPALLLMGEQQDEVEVALDGVMVERNRYELTDSALLLHEPPPAGHLTVRSRIRPAANSALEGLYISSGVFCTQCEPEGFRRITY